MSAQKERWAGLQEEPTRDQLLELLVGAAWLLDSPLVPDCVKNGPTARAIRDLTEMKAA